MNIRAKTILMAVALSAAGTALNSQAADQSAFFEQQREMTDGSYLSYKVVPTPARSKPATARQIAEDNWLTAERTRGSSTGFQPIPFPVPAVTPTVTVRPMPSAAADSPTNVAGR